MAFQPQILLMATGGIGIFPPPSQLCYRRNTASHTTHLVITQPPGYRNEVLCGDVDAAGPSGGAPIDTNPLLYIAIAFTSAEAIEETRACAGATHDHVLLQCFSTSRVHMSI